MCRFDYMQTFRKVHSDRSWCRRRSQFHYKLCSSLRSTRLWHFALCALCRESLTWICQARQLSALTSLSDILRCLKNKDLLMGPSKATQKTYLDSIGSKKRSWVLTSWEPDRLPHLFHSASKLSFSIATFLKFNKERQHLAMAATQRCSNCELLLEWNPLDLSHVGPALTSLLW